MLLRINLALALCLAFLCGQSQLPFFYDNKVYKAVYLNEAFSLMKEKPGYLLLDVRSPGEYADTSMYAHMNMGRLQGALNIDIDSVRARLAELKKYSDKDVFVYCSHSQRSRKVSKFLSENGFGHVYNINGGMSAVNETDANALSNKQTMFTTSKSYTNIASTDAATLILKEHGLFIIDLRNKIQFESRDSNMENNLGRIKNAVNIPHDSFTENFPSQRISKDRSILLYDQNEESSPEIAAWLIAAGYKKVYNLFEGLSNLLCDNFLDQTLIKDLVMNDPPYKVIGVRATISLLTKQPGIVILDTRPAKEFDNKAENKFMNLGHLGEAVNVASGNLSSNITGRDKKTSFLVYGSGRRNLDQSASLCRQLAQRGFQKVYLLYPGLYGFIWSTANIENCKEGRSFLVDHDGIY